MTINHFGRTKYTTIYWYSEILQTSKKNILEKKERMYILACRVVRDRYF